MKPTLRAHSPALTALVLATLSIPVFAVTKTYEGPNNGNYATGPWSPTGLPAASDDVVFGSFEPAGLTGNLTVTMNTAATVNSITLNSSALPAYIIVNETAGGAITGGNETIGTSTNDNIFNQSGNSTNSCYHLNLGVNSQNNQYNLSGATTSLTLSSDLNIGVSGTAVFTQSGGTVTPDNGNVTLGVNAGSFGTYSLSNGSLNLLGSLLVGNYGGGTFNQSGGSISASFIDVGSVNSTAAFNYAGGAIYTANEPFVSANGTFYLQPGASLGVNVQLGAGGNFTMAGGSFAAGAGLDVNGGTFQLEGLSTTIYYLNGDGGIIQNGASTPAVLTLNLGASALYYTTIQDGGTGSLGLTMIGGTFSVVGSNTYSGPTLLQAGTFVAAANASLSPNSNITLTGGTLSVGAFAENIPSFSGASGTVTIAAGGNLTIGASNLSMTYAGTLTGGGILTKAGTGTLTLSGGGSFTGTLNVQGTLIVGTPNGIPTGATVNLAGLGTTFDVNANQSLAGFSAADLTPTVFANNPTLTVGSGNVDTVLGGNFSGTGTLAKVGTGNLTLGSGANDNFANNDANLSFIVNAGQLILNKAPGTIAVAGPLTIAGGTVLLDASNQIAATSPVTLNSGTLNLNNFNQTIASLSGSGGNITLGNGTFTVTQSVAGSSTAALTGTNAFIKSGAANLTLTSTSGYAGAFIANAGRLILQGPLNASSFTANSGGTLQFNANTLNIPGLQILANTGGTIEYLGATISNAFLRGTGTHTILAGATSTFNAVTTFNSTTLTQNGPASLNDFTNGGTLNNNAPLTFNGGTNSTSGIINVANALATQDFTSNGVINIALGATLTNSNSDLYLGGGSRTYIGSSDRNGGTLTLLNATTLEVNGALLVNDGTISGTTDVNYGGTAEGIGSYGPVNVSFGGTFQPGFASSGIVNNNAIVTQLSGTGTIDNTSAGPMTLTLTGSSTSTFSGPIQNSNGSTALSVQGTSSLTLLTTQLANGSQSINTFTGGLSIAPGGSVTIGAPGALPAASPVANNGAFAVNANSTASTVTGSGALTLGTAAALTLAPNSGASKQSALSLTPTSQLNLTNNPFILEAPDTATKTTDITQLATEVKTGRNNGTWNGPGITSSTAAANPINISIAIADNAVLGYTTYGGQPVDSNSILVVPALFGDSNLDGHVDLSDLNTVLNHLGTSTGAWTSGNFDGASTIDLTDLNDVLNHLGVSLAVPTSTLAPSTPTPEPTSLLLLTVGPIAFLRKRRQHR